MRFSFREQLLTMIKEYLVYRRLKLTKQLGRIERLLMTQELQLQDLQTLATTQGEGLTRLIQMVIDMQTNHPDNPAIQDEIDNIRVEMQRQLDATNAILNPPPPV